MLLENFLRLVLPTEGFKCWTSITKEKIARNHFCTSIEELADQIRANDALGIDTYHACASFTTPQNRRAGNALGAQAFWMDIDVGEGKPYATAEDALCACDEFASRAGIPIPGIVRSGYGIHAYWTLDRLLLSGEWLHYSQRLKLLSQAFGLHADPSRTADIASILRSPGTKNYKLSHSPREVVVEDADCFERIETDAFIKSLSDCNPGPNSALYSSIPSSPVVANRNILAGVAGKAFDASQGISQGGRNNACLKYAGELVAKNHTFEEVLQKCLLWADKCTPPLPENEVRTTVQSVFRMHSAKHPAPVLPIEVEKLPDLPQGFEWVAGQLVAVIKVKSETIENLYELERKVISPHPVYLSTWLNEEGQEHKNSYLFKQYHPVNGWYDIIMNTAEINGREWYKTWSQKGGCILEGADKFFSSYVRRAEVMLRIPGKEQVRYSQFGWKNNDKSILIGNLLCHADGTVEKAVGTGNLTPFMDLMKPAPGGSLEGWSNGAARLGTPGMEPHLFMVVASFAALLMKFCVGAGDGGSILSMVSEESGHGKTPMAEAMASVWGKQGSIVSTGNTTGNRHIEDLVRRRHLPQVQDEMPYRDPIIAAEGVKQFTSGTSRSRLDRSGAAAGMPESYQTLMVSLSNKSLHQLVSMVDGPMSRRIFEIEVERPDKDLIANLSGLTREMMENCGYAGIAFARLIVNPQIYQYIVDQLRGPNLEQVGITQLHYRKLLKSSPEHRFIVWILSAVDVASRILTKFNIMHFDSNRLMDWAVMQATTNFSAISLAPEQALQRIDGFMREHADNCLTVLKPFSQKEPCVPLKLPRGPLAIRYEMHPPVCYINQELLGKWCTKNSVSMMNLGKSLDACRVVVERSKLITMSAGTEIPGGRSLCWVIDMAHPSMSGRAQLVAAAIDKESEIRKA